MGMQINKEGPLKIFLNKRRDAAPLKITCIECGFEANGSAGEAREIARAHRRERHPDRPEYAVRPKKPPKGKVVKKK
jgi:hypothetical protein